MPSFLKRVLPTLLLASTATHAQTSPSAPPTASVVTPYSPASEVNSILPPWLRFDGEFRTRFEGYTGGSFKPNSSDTYILTRLKLDLTIRPTSWLRFFGEGYDARAIEKAPAIPPYQNTWDIRQAYVELGDTENQTLGLIVGRQVINLGDQRLVGESPFTNVERTFDAVVGTVRSHGYRLELLSASVVNAVDGTRDHHQQSNNLHGLYGGIEKLIPGATIEPYIFWRLQHGVKTEENVVSKVNEKVPGIRWVGRLPIAFDYGTEMVKEYGNLGTDRIRSWAGHWVVGRTSKSLWSSPRLYAEFNHAAGDRNPKDGIRGTFDQLYPSGHDKYGLTDQIGWRNMNDYRAGLETKPLKNLALSAEYNNWFLASATDAMYNSSGTALFRSASGAYGKHIGQELDFIANWTVFKQLQVGTGFGHIFPGLFLKSATPGNPYNFPYLMLTYRL